MPKIPDDYTAYSALIIADWVEKGSAKEKLLALANETRLRIENIKQPEFKNLDEDLKKAIENINNIDEEKFNKLAAVVRTNSKGIIKLMTANMQDFFGETKDQSVNPSHSAYQKGIFGERPDSKYNLSAVAKFAGIDESSLDSVVTIVMAKNYVGLYAPPLTAQQAPPSSDLSAKVKHQLKKLRRSEESQREFSATELQESITQSTDKRSEKVFELA